MVRLNADVRPSRRLQRNGFHCPVSNSRRKNSAGHRSLLLRRDCFRSVDFSAFCVGVELVEAAATSYFGECVVISKQQKPLFNRPDVVQRHCFTHAKTIVKNQPNGVGVVSSVRFRTLNLVSAPKFTSRGPSLALVCVRANTKERARPMQKILAAATSVLLASTSVTMARSEM